MPLLTTLASLSQTPASNAADGSVDAPSTMDNQVNLLAAFIAQLRDGSGFTTGAGNVGQCRLTKSGSNLLLSPFMGNGLTINGVIQKIPAAGVALAPTSLSVGTTYYIYAYMVSTVMTLEAVTTGHSTDATTGVEIKTADTTRTLVGIARVITGPAWQDTTNQRYVLSWFNRRSLVCGPTVLPTSQGNIGTSPSEITTGLRNEFLAWGGELCSFAFEGSVSNNVAAAQSTTSIAFDGTVSDSYSAGQATNAGTFIPFACSARATLTEGYHYATPFAMQNVVSTATYAGSGTAGARSVHSGSVQG